MEPEYRLILKWTGPALSEVPGGSSQWGHSIVIAGDPKRVGGSKWKSFMADMYGFTTDGELAYVCNYLRTHGGYEIEQVPHHTFTTRGGLTFYKVDCDWSRD